MYKYIYFFEIPQEQRLHLMASITDLDGFTRFSTTTVSSSWLARQRPTSQHLLRAEGQRRAINSVANAHAHAY